MLGGSGILGSEVLRQLKANDLECSAPQSSELDIRDSAELENFALLFRPNWIINCAAWTNVERAEDSFEDALELNKEAVCNIAEVANQIDSQIIHISTDYVFDGESSEPYDENALVAPINNYGESKLRGEMALLTICPARTYIIRTSWLYGVMGKNFVKTITKKALSNESAQVVDDQLGSPTSARDLSKAILTVMSNRPLQGIYNFSNSGSCTWYELARTIYGAVGADVKLVSATSSESLNSKAKRPRYSLLSKDKWELSGLGEIMNWELSLMSLLPEILAEVSRAEEL